LYFAPPCLIVKAGSDDLYPKLALGSFFSGVFMFGNAPGITMFAMMLPFLAALVAPSLVRKLGSKAAWILALAPLFIFLLLLGFSSDIGAGEVITGGYVWVPSFGVSFSWFLDGLSLTFGLLITGIGTLIILYAGGYLSGHDQLGRFLAFMFLFMGAMLGVVMSDSFFTFFIYWELTSITSFLLIGFDHKRRASRRSAIQALVVTGGGGLALMAGLIILWLTTGANHFSFLLSENQGFVAQSPYYLAILLLVLGAAFTKSAQFPFHFWLPNAMEAPTPVSAYLHSATMVKAGIYLLMRLNPVLGGTVEWLTILPIFGGITLIVGTLLAVRQTDLKLMLAYTTVSSLGLLVMLIGYGTEKAIGAAVLYLVAHSLFKGALFMVAGIIDHEAGTRDVTKLGGLRKAMPITFGAALVAAISMAGLPPLFGFLAKEDIYYALWGMDTWSLALTLTAIVGNALMFVIGFVVALKPFLGPKVETPKHAHDGPALLWLGPVVLGTVAVLGGIFSSFSHYFVSIPMSSAVWGELVNVTISIIPHFGAALVLSALTVALGMLAYMNVDRLRGAIDRFYNWFFGGWGPDKGFDQFISGIVQASFWITRKLQGGKLEVYMTCTFATIAAALIIPIWFFDELPKMPDFTGEVNFYEAAVMAIVIIGLLAVIYAKDRLTAIVSLGIQGFAVALLYMLFGAPDLSFTQFMVETLAVVILALVMTRLKLSAADHRPWGEFFIDMGVALACGIGFMLFLMRVTQDPFDPSLSEFFAAYSKIIAHGANIVNVIIVDYRGTDTWGELAVVMVAGLAILALVRIKSPSQVKVADNVPDDDVLGLAERKGASK
jgi:multicomponent Na+:H+ antiporter subunit A